eukprot:NODE_334_length_9322_cov_0.874458.p1 type:complete len:538 gc:universal NODE_334_length_9322_cov_0.874458:3525-5138(+)
MFDINYSNGKIKELKPDKLKLMQKIRHIIFFPDTKEYKRWSNVVVFSVFFTIITTPVMLAFGLSNILMDGVTAIMDIIFILDLVISLRTAYLDKTGKWVVGIFDIRHHQLTDTAFWMDFIGSIPFAWFAVFAPPQWQAFFRLNRLTRIFKIYLYFNKREQELSAGFTIKLVKFAVFVGLFILYSSCIWYMMGCWGTLCEKYEDLDGNWTITVGPKLFHEYGKLEQFMVCFYFVTYSIGTVGFGDIYPMVATERIFCCVLMMLGNLVVGYTTAIVTSDLANAKQRFIAIHERFLSLMNYLLDGKVSNSIIFKCIEFYNEYWRRNRGIDFDTLLNELPHAYRTDILFCANVDALKKVSIFEGFSNTFYRAIASRMKPKFFLPGDIIFYQGDIGHEMYTIVHGEVEVCNGDCSKVFDTMGPGKGFGEIALIVDTNRTASIRAKSYVDVYYLKDEDLTHTMQFFPELIPRLEQVAEERLAKIRERDNTTKFSKRNLKSGTSTNANSGAPTPFYTPLQSAKQSKENLVQLQFLKIDKKERQE